MTATETNMVRAWRQAADDLGIQFTSPFTLTKEARSFECLGLVHHFGGQVGTIISVMSEPSSRANALAQDGYEMAELSASYAEYRRADFIEMLNDWRFYGPNSDRPSWYTSDFRDTEHPD